MFGPHPTSGIDGRTRLELPCILTVPYVNEQVGNVEASEPIAQLERLLEQRNVLGKVDVGISQSLRDQRAAKDQSAADDITAKHMATQVVAGLPEGIGEREHARVGKSGHVGLARHDRRDLMAEPARSVPIVVVPVGDDLTPGVPAGDVTLFSDARPFGKMNVADAFLTFEEVADRFGAVVNDDELFVRVVLVEETTKGNANERTSIGGRHDARDERRRVFRTGGPRPLSNRTRGR